MRYRAWVKFFLGLLFFGFVFAGAIAISDKKPLFGIHKMVLENHIDPTAFFYTDSEEFTRAENYLSEAMTRH